MRPSAKSQCGSGPTTGLNSQAQLRPDEESRHRPGQEHQRLDDRRGRGKAVEKQRQDQAEDELEEHGRAKVHQKVLRSARKKFLVLGERAEMGETDEAALEGVEDLHVAEGVGDAELSGTSMTVTMSTSTGAA